MNENEILVYDVGGTFTRAGIYDTEKDKIVRAIRAPTPSIYRFPTLSHHAIRPLLYDTLRSMSAKLKLRRPSIVSVGFPGPIDSMGVAFCAPTVWGPALKPEPVQERLQNIWPASHVVVANDLTLAGYCLLGDVSEDFCVVTVSSGIGHKVFVEGRPVVGKNGRGGEIGHLRVDHRESAPICDCGGRGHLGALASGRAVPVQARWLAEQSPADFAKSSVGKFTGGHVSHLDNELVAREYVAGDSWTNKLIGNMARPLGQALAAVHATVGVERFVIIGGFANALGHGYLDLVARAAERSEWSLGQDWHQMFEFGNSGDDSVLIGAGRLATQLHKSKDENVRRPPSDLRGNTSHLSSVQ